MFTDIWYHMECATYTLPFSRIALPLNRARGKRNQLNDVALFFLHQPSQKYTHHFQTRCLSRRVLCQNVGQIWVAELSRRVSRFCSVSRLFWPRGSNLHFGTPRDDADGSKACAREPDKATTVHSAAETAEDTGSRQATMLAWVLRARTRDCGAREGSVERRGVRLGTSEGVAKVDVRREARAWVGQRLRVSANEMLGLLDVAAAALMSSTRKCRCTMPPIQSGRWWVRAPQL